jgi:predicted rRNA methylase YqxC with S4 and FtsJ domains
MNKQRLDQLLVNKGLVSSRSQAENYIKLGEVQVNGKTISKPGFFVSAALLILRCGTGLSK